MADELKPLPKKITKEIRSILEGCQSGKLAHDQETFFNCGTARCIAGWKVVKDFSAHVGRVFVRIGENNNAPPRLDRFIRATTGGSWYRSDPWGYAQKVWRLTNAEAATLFGYDATFNEQFALLEELERGGRKGTHGNREAA